MENKYIINVAENCGTRLDGSTKWVHFFRTEVVDSESVAQDVFFSLKHAYPDCKVTVTYWEATGRQLYWL